MQHTYNGIVYRGILPLTLNTFKVLKMSNDSTRVFAMLQNEDALEFWMLEPTNLHEAVGELIRFYMTAEPWACFDSIMFFVAAFEHYGAAMLKELLQKLVSEGKLEINTKTGHLKVVAPIIVNDTK
jgi:hypothetical protein